MRIRGGITKAATADAVLEQKWLHYKPQSRDVNHAPLAPPPRKIRLNTNKSELKNQIETESQEKWKKRWKSKTADITN